MSIMSMRHSGDVIRRMRVTLDLFELGETMLRQRLRREKPAASDDEVEAAVREWRTRRPGAELGDAPGRLRPWPPA
jgi:hypothetical protein